MSSGGMEPATVMHSNELFAKDSMPKIRQTSSDTFPMTRIRVP